MAVDPADRVPSDRRRGPRGTARDRILAAATDLFSRQGYEATGVQEIVAAADVTKGALYHWFGSKEDLLVTIYRDLLAEQTRRLVAIAGSPQPVGQRIHAAAEDLMDHVAEHAEELTVWARSAHALTGESATAMRRDRRRYHEVFRDLVREGQRAGVVRDDVSATVIAHTFLSVVGTMHTWFRPDGPLTRRQAGDQIVALFLGSLRPVRGDAG